VQLHAERERIVLTVEDDGKGFSGPGQGDHGLGLAGMADRAEEIGGTLSLGKRSNGKSGAVVTAGFALGTLP